MVELPSQSILDSIINVLTVCKCIGQDYEHECGHNPAHSLAEYSHTDIEYRAKQITSFVLLHGWCQIHLVTNAHLQLSFKVRAGKLTMRLVPSEESKEQFAEVIQHMKCRIEDIMTQEKELVPA